MQTMTFSRARVRFDAPQSACPGEAFPVRFVLDNDTPAELEACSLLLGFQGCTPVLDTVFIDGVPTASDSLQRAQEGYLLRTPALLPGERFDVNLNVAAPLPFNEEAVFVSYELFVPGEKLTDRRAIATPQTVLFEERFCRMRMDGDNEIARGEARRVRFRVRNTGSGIARDVSLDLRTAGLRVDRLEQLGTLTPGERRDVEAIIVAEGGRRKNLTITPVLNWRGGSLDFGQVSFEQVAEAAFEPTTSTLRFASDQPLSPRGGIYDVAITLRNTGKRPAVAPIVQLELPPGTELLAGQDIAAADCTIPFPDIPGGETRERIVHLKSRASESLKLRAIVGDFSFTPLDVPVNVVHSLSVERMDAPEECTVGDSLPVTIDVLNDGNATLTYAQLVLRHLSPHLTYVPDSLSVNGGQIPDKRFVREGVVAFRNVQPGALMSISFAFQPDRPTLHGQRAGIGLQARWPGGERSFEAPAISIRPAQVELGALFQLDDGEPIIDESPVAHVRLDGTTQAADAAHDQPPSAVPETNFLSGLEKSEHSPASDGAQGDSVGGSIAASTTATEGAAVGQLPDLGPVGNGIRYFDGEPSQNGSGAHVQPEAIATPKTEAAASNAEVEPVEDLHELRDRIGTFAQSLSSLGEHDIIVSLLFPRPTAAGGYSTSATRWIADVNDSEVAAIDPATYMLSDDTKAAVSEATEKADFADAVAALAPTIAGGYPTCSDAVSAYVLAVAEGHRDGTSAKPQLDTLLEALAA